MWPLDARELAAWWERYDRAKFKYVRGFWTHFEAIDELMNLRYRSDALKIEMKEWAKARQDYRDSIVVNKQRAHLEDLERQRRERQLEHDARDVTAASSE